MDPVDHELCVACGFDGSVYDAASLVAAVRALGPRWRALLAEAGPELRERPELGVWSAIEYAAHSRDVTALHVFGVGQALNDDEPVFPAIDGDALIEAAATDYATEDPKAVVDAIDSEAARLAGMVGDADAGAWERGVTIGTDRSTVRRMLEHALHDSLHHVYDVEGGLRRLRASG